MIARRPTIVPPPKRAQRQKRKPPRTRAIYSVITLGGISLVVLGVGLVFPPAALVLAGLAAGGLGLIGLGITVTR